MSKKKRPEAAAERCRQALARVEAAIDNHRHGRPEDLSVAVLENVALELRKMEGAMDKTVFRPSYGRFLLDWPDGHGLVEYLLGVSQDYERWT